MAIGTKTRDGRVERRWRSRVGEENRPAMAIAHLEICGSCAILVAFVFHPMSVLPLPAESSEQAEPTATL